jgi:hypothetical protein
MKNLRHYKKIIIGGGISGLLALHYNKDAVLFEASNSIATDFLNDLFPKYIHCKQNILELYEELKIIPQKEEFKIKVYYKSDEIDFFSNNLTDLQKAIIYEDYCNKKYEKIKENKMNGFVSGNNEKFYIKNKKELIKKLHRENMKRIFLKYKAINIDLKSKLIHFDRGKTFSYDTLISTIPIDIFSRLTCSDVNISELNLSLVCCILKNRRHEFFNRDFIYVPDLNYTFHRINVCKEKRMITFELCNDTSCSFDIYAFLHEKNLEYKKIFEIDYKIPYVNQEVKIDGVKFLGRFATGDYEIQVSDILEELRNEK